MGKNVSDEEYISRAAIVKHAFNEQLNRKSLKYHWHDAEVTVLEGVFARGDRKTSEVIKEAYRLGCLYDSWSDQFDNDKWMQAFENTGIDIAFYNLRERPLDEVFPWDSIDIGVTKRIPETRVESCNECRSNTELPYEMFRLRCCKMERRCLY